MLTAYFILLGRSAENSLAFRFRPADHNVAKSGSNDSAQGPIEVDIILMTNFLIGHHILN